MFKEILIVVVIYYWFLVLTGSAEVIKTKSCRKGREMDVKGKVSEVSIEPCPTLMGGTCGLYRGTNVTIVAKFSSKTTPASASACNLKSTLVWISKIEMDFGGLSSNACDHMECPLLRKAEKVFNATVYVSRVWPTGYYHLKLRIQESGGPRRTFLCQVFKVWISDPPTDSSII